MQNTASSAAYTQLKYSFRNLLQDELARRCRANPNYSLRAFARALGIEPSALSQILSGKRPLTDKMKMRLGAALGMKIENLKKIPSKTTASAISVPNFQKLDFDTFAMIAEWYHYAILELTYTDGFKLESAWISKRLGITKSETNTAIERLVSLGLLKQLEGGKWKDNSEGGNLSSLHPKLSSAAAKQNQQQLLELSKKAVQEVPIQHRNHTSAAFCFNSEDTERAVARIAEFRRSFAAEFQPLLKADEVYQLQISFFPLTKIEQKTKQQEVL